MQAHESTAPSDPVRDVWTPGRELRQSLTLIGLLVASVGSFLGIGALAVRVLAG